MLKWVELMENYNIIKNPASQLSIAMCGFFPIQSVF